MSVGGEAVLHFPFSQRTKIELPILLLKVKFQQSHRNTSAGSCSPSDRKLHETLWTLDCSFPGGLWGCQVGLWHCWCGEDSVCPLQISISAVPAGWPLVTHVCK